ncbi:MFS transporter [Microbacterium sp. 18062]|uniref:MFS transporter n=1 Tax=Microbacterium sp. 18062 TaxID=2681410 RepID=UPI00135AB819|nr:MFS transporter [Microbacterium sp. 18062]
MAAIFRSLKVPGYRVYFFGALVSNVGSWMDRIAQDWLVLAILTDNNAFAVGITMGLQFTPALVLSPLAGTVADRFDRKTVLLITQTLIALFSLVLGVVTLLGAANLPLVFAFAFLSGVVSAFDAPARQAVIGELVPSSLLSNAVNLNSSSFNAARMVGPAVAGLLIALIGPGWVFLINAAMSVAVIMVLVGLIRTARTAGTKRTGARSADVRGGLRYLQTRPDILVIFAMVFVVGALGLNFPVYIAAMARIEFGAGSAAYGLMSSMIALGSLAGGLTSARRDRPRLRVITVAAACFGLSLALAAVMPNMVLFGAALIPAGFFSLTMLTSANAYVQTTTPSALRGRVISFYMAILMGGSPIGSPLIGYVAEAANPRVSMLLGVTAGLAAAGIAASWYLIDRHRRRLAAGPA